MTNEQAVAEFYWTLKAIKEATGVTPKCWRPPQGDVDDRIRSIAWQLGMRTVMWDWDTNDWDMPAPGGGDLPVSVVNGYFEKWIASEKAGKEKTGHIVLEHELNHATVNMTEKWLPTLQETFNVLPALACNGVTEPYWETGFVYPLINQPANTSSSSGTKLNLTSTTANIAL
jgi:peptidoglycan/xylan/chitin deacetylase (PgdA/CDA1 family)